MFTSWSIILVLNFLWVTFLYTQRDYDHPWLFPFFLVSTSTDFFGWLLSPKTVGGVALLSPSLLGHLSWATLLSLCWLSWFVLVFFASLKLEHHKVGNKWLIIGVCGSVLLVSLLQGLPFFETVYRRGMSRFLLEPFLLLASLYLVARHCVHRMRSGLDLDYFVYVVATSIFCLGLKLVVMLDSSLVLIRQMSQAYYYVHLFALVAAYFVNRRVTKWLLQQS